MKDQNKRKGMYCPELESDSCGVGMVIDLDSKATHRTVNDALSILERMEHRGATGIDPNSGDGAGILTLLPHSFFHKIIDPKFHHRLKAESYGVGQFFFPKGPAKIKAAKKLIEQIFSTAGIDVLQWRHVPVNPSILGKTSLQSEPEVHQVFVTPHDHEKAPETFENTLYHLRNKITTEVAKIFSPKKTFYVVSLSSRTIVYKGQLTAKQLRKYYPDLSDEHYSSVLAMVHSRFATNTEPRWELAQPFRCIAHNGEINTIKGNLNWWKARFNEQNRNRPGVHQEKKESVCRDHFSDSGNFDQALNFLTNHGRSMAHSIMMMIPEAWQNDPVTPVYKKDFYEYHENIMEPWDGPAAICFTDGLVAGASLDRNGLRPSRYLRTTDNRLVLGSEAGCLDVLFDQIAEHGRIQPGKLLLVDLKSGEIIKDELLKDSVCKEQPYGDWLQQNRTHIKDIPCPTYARELDLEPEELLVQQLAHGYTKEDVDLILSTMSLSNKEPIGSMGADIPLAVLSQVSQHISHYFKQQFAQVTNPAIDPLREKLYMSLETALSNHSRLIDSGPESALGVRLDSPVLSEIDYIKLRHCSNKSFSSADVNLWFYANGSLQKTLDEICSHIEDHIDDGANMIFINNRKVDEEKVPIPTLLAVGTIHHYLIDKGLRNQVSLIINASDLIETHHLATLISYGADAVYPSLALDTIEQLHLQGKLSEIRFYRDAQKKYIKALETGLLKIMSKLGISTVLSYRGAQTFEALGLHQEVINQCFKGTISRIGGMTFDMLQQEAIKKHTLSMHSKDIETVPDLGIYQWKRNGEFHLFNPESIHLLQYATAKNDPVLFRKYQDAIDRQENKACTLRSLLGIKESQTSIPLDEVEPVESILKRFATGAMSFGSISHEAHSTLAIAMNRIGAKSNSGEGGEDEARFQKKANGDWERSAIKQVASGRFGVTIHYLSEADELQIKIAQGAKPGEGGQLPGHKVDDWIARVRHSTPGVGLISPPPHHDIYSIEDLAQLIYDLKRANPKARISVKLVSKAGVGIIASGVAKAKANHILISGSDGGTGASPLSSIRHAGIPWELGLSETHQTLVRNGLRDRITLQVDGQIRTAKDMAIATMLGAEEWGISTAALVVEGCILMRKCHLNTCPVGIATQKPELRKKFNGKVEHLVNYFTLLAEEMRVIMASLGIRKVKELVGRSDLLYQVKDSKHWKAQSVDLSGILYTPENKHGGKLHYDQYRAMVHEELLDYKLLKVAMPALEEEMPMTAHFNITNTDRTVGTLLSHEIANRFGAVGLQDGMLQVVFKGVAGQSFGAFGAAGLSLKIEGAANDYFGKGLSGATLAICPPAIASYPAHENIIIGNVALYGATSGKVYISGRAGERFAVRNSGVHAVVEGVGDNACEYMTGGRVLILGSIGRNFAAGMSGGTAYIFDPKDEARENINFDMVSIETNTEKDLEEIHMLLSQHLEMTGSVTAMTILDTWDESAQHFIRILPNEYKAILRKQQETPILITSKSNQNG